MPDTTLGLFPAYQMDCREDNLPFDFITYCVECAYRLSRAPFIISGRGVPDTMEDVISAMVLTAIENGTDPSDHTPYGLTAPEGVCDECRRPFGEAA